MNNKFKLKGNVIVEEKLENNLVTTNVLDGDKKVLLSEIKVSDDIKNYLALDEYYILSYIKKKSFYSVDIKGAYNLHSKRLVDLSNEKISTYLEYMYITKKSFDLECVLSELNSSNLNIVKIDKLRDFKRYLTSSNLAIPKEEIKTYILKIYPELERYSNLNSLSLEDYKNICSELKKTSYEFNSMPRDLSYVENDKNVPKVLTKKRK